MAFLALGAASAPAQPAGPDADALLRLSGRVSGAELDRRIAAARAHPLGSRDNPVRVHMPPGQRAYLSRLRCFGGAAPEFGRVGSFGAGPYGSIIDGYRVLCPTGSPPESLVFMDMYHPGHEERAAPPGFTVRR